MTATMNYEQPELPASYGPGPGSKRPLSLDGASAWRDVFRVDEDLQRREVTGVLDDKVHISKQSEADHSSSCYDRGDSAHLEDSPVSTNDAYTIRSRDDDLAAVGTGNDSSLEHELRNATIRGWRDEYEFIPIDEFDKILTRQSVRRELQSCLAKLPKEKDLDYWVSAVWDRSKVGKKYTSRRKIFAALVLFNAPEKIISFIDEVLWDKDLPFVLNDDNKWECQGQSETRIVKCLSNPNEWSWRDLDSFESYQWRMLSPIFDMAEGKVIFYHLHRRIPLPFKDSEHVDEDPLGGGFADVARVLIYPGHYKQSNSIDDPLNAFAIKRLRSKDKTQFDLEVESLERFSDGNYPHLIKLLATYSHGGYYHMIFPWAEGNLKDFWRRHPKPNRTYELALWIADQCRGIAKGLKMIHHDEFQHSLSPTEAKKGRHGDIKPENILWFKGSGSDSIPRSDVLKISDFGLTRWHRDVSNHKKYAEGLAVSLTYRAPETSLDMPVSQPWDIWTLGCVFLEFLTWYLLGWEKGVDEFSKQRTSESPRNPIPEDNFFNLGSAATGLKHGASLKGCVINWINKLHATEGCSHFIHDFLDLISDSMLRIRYKERHECKYIVNELEKLHEKCKNEAYCFERAHNQPRKRNTKDSDLSNRCGTATTIISQVVDEHAHLLVTTDDSTLQSSSHEDGVASTGDHVNGSEPNDKFQQMTESPLLASPTSSKFPSKAPSTARGLKENEIRSNSKQPLAMSPAYNSTDTASMSDPEVIERSGNLHRIQEEDTFLQPRTSRDGLSGHKTEVEEGSRSSVSIQRSSHSRQPSSKPKAERCTESLFENDSGVRGETIREQHYLSKRKRLISWLKGIVCFRVE
ncbi:hypothetical protein F4818DRAFT_419468 [Hypoxylon cercidicola]|nr:hypothetical protein F4818DRAFT_419468 [Hypoxylon cercidicola]